MSQVRLKRLFTLAVTTIVIASISGCTFYPHVTPSDVLANPTAYNGKKVYLDPVVVAHVEEGTIKYLRPMYYEYMKKYGDDTGYIYVRDANYVGYIEPAPYVKPSIGQTVHSEGTFRYTPDAPYMKHWVESED